MPNHVHLILKPETADGLGRAVGEAHRRYTNFINARGRWTGHLFQSRFASVAMDEAHLMAAARYVSLNPVRARLAPRAWDWPWSSVRAHLAHLAGADDELVQVRPILDREPGFAAMLEEGARRGSPRCGGRRDRAGRSGRPISSRGWSGCSDARSPGAHRAGAPRARLRGRWTWGFRYRVDVFH
jgi:putative transposase